MAVVNSTDIFGANGAHDPEVFKPHIGLSRKIDFSLASLKADASEEKRYAFLPIPKNFVIMGIYLEEMEECSAGDISVKPKSTGTAIGSALTVGGATLAKSVAAVTATAVADGDVACLCITGGSDGLEITEGVLKVNIVGYLADGDSRVNFDIAPFRSTNQVEGENASKGDIALRR